MLQLQNATIETFLPLAKMRAIAPAARVAYTTAKPYPHVVFDDFFDPALLDMVLAEFPKPG
jgi:hypothetical protein